MVEVLVLLVISVALAIASMYVFKPKAPGGSGFARDDKPTTLAIRGAFVPWLVGRRRVGPIFGWAGNRQVVAEAVGSAGGKGGGKKKKQYQSIYYEDGWHEICVGPAYRLHKIWMDGAIIFEGPIDINSHPSGSTIDLGSVGSFQIYWGEIDQPVNTYLGDASRVNVASRWPLLCYVVWRGKRLGQQARWPLIDYEIETRIIAATQTVSGAPWMEATRELTGSPISISSVTTGAPGTSKIRLAGNYTSLFQSGGYLQVVGNTTATFNGDYKVRSVDYIPKDPIYGPPGRFGPPIIGYTQDYTDVYLEYGVVAASNDGTVQPYAVFEDDGANPAHVVSRLLFDRWPHGMELDTADFDLTTLDDISQLCIDENVPMSVFCQDGQTASAMLGTIMQDMSFGISWDVNKGQYIFRAARKDDPADIALVTADMLLPPNPEINITHGVRPVDKMVFTFSDRATNYRDNTIAVDDDSQGDFLGQQRPRKIDLYNVISHEVANRIVERRMQEDLASASTIRFTMSRKARTLVPIQAILVEGYPGIYRVERIEIDPLSGKVQVQAIGDVYGAVATTFELAPGEGPNPNPSIPEADLFVNVIEVSSYVSPGVQEIIVPRIRANAQIVGADIFLSRDDVSYQHMGEDKSVYTGGTLVAEFNLNSRNVLAQGPVIQALGPDIGNVLDLSGDVASWRSGRQFAQIGEETCYLQKVTALGGGQYRLDGLIRARFDTDKETHPAGTPVFLFTNDVFRIEDVLLAPEVTLFCKPSPKAASSLPLSLIVPIEKFLIGKGIAPMRLGNLRAGLVSGSNGYRAGEAIPIKWTYRSKLTPRTGAGLQAAGAPCGVSAVEGQFAVVIRKMDNTIVRQFQQVEKTYLYTNLNLIGDFGSEPASFKVQVTNVNAGLSSPTEEIIVTKY